MSFKSRIHLIVVLAFLWISIGVYGQCDENRTVLVLKANTTMQTFHSPNYPRPYPRYSYCQWLIESPSANYSIEMVTKHLDIELYDSGCNFDRITVYSGVKKSRSSGRRFCMGNLTVTSGPQLLVVFESDGHMSGKGFHFGYLAFWNPPVTSTPSPPTKGKGVDKWVVIGGVAGGIAFIIIVALICCKGCGGSREPRRPPSHHAAGYYHSHGPPTPLHGSPGDSATFSTSVHMMQQSSNTVFMVSQSVGGNVPPPHVLTDLRNGVTNMGYEDGGGDPALGPGGGLGPPVGVPPPSYSESMLHTNPPSVPPTPRHTPGRLPALPVYVHNTGLAPPPLFAPRGGPAPVPGYVSEGSAATGGTSQQTGGTTQQQTGGTTEQTGGTTEQTGPPPCDQTSDSAPELAPPPAAAAASPVRSAALPTIAETVTEPAVETAGESAVVGMSARPNVVEIPSQSAAEPPEANTGEPSARSSVVEPPAQAAVEPATQPTAVATSAQPEPAMQPTVVATSAQPEPATQPTAVATSAQPEPAMQPTVVATSAQPAVKPPTQPTVVATSAQPAVKPPTQPTVVATSAQPAVEPPTQPTVVATSEQPEPATQLTEVATSSKPEVEPVTQPTVVATSEQPEPAMQPTVFATSAQVPVEPVTQPTVVATSEQPEPAMQPTVVGSSEQPTRDGALEQITDIEPYTQSSGDGTSAQLSMASSDTGTPVNDPNQRTEASADSSPSPKDVSTLGQPSQTPGSPVYEPQTVDESGLSSVGAAEQAAEESMRCSEENDSSASPRDVRQATESHSSSCVAELTSDTNEQALVESPVPSDTTSACKGTDSENNVETAPTSGTPPETPQSETLTGGQKVMDTEIVTASQVYGDEQTSQAQDSTHTDVREDIQTIPASDVNVTSAEHNENSNEPSSKDDDPVSPQPVDDAVSEANTYPEDEFHTDFVPRPPVSDDKFHDHIERSASGSTLPPPAILYTCESLDSDPDSFPAPPPPLAED